MTPCEPPNGNNVSIRVSFMTTGTVKIRPLMRSQPISNHWVITRRLRAFCDRGWTEKLPIGIFLISHPDGPILFDTGDSTHHNDPGFVPCWSPLAMLTVTTISRDDGIVSQLRTHGVEPSTLQAIVLSHLHGDHAGGLPDLAAAAPNVPVYVNEAHWDAVTNASHFSNTIQGFAPQHWPANFKPRFLERTNHAVGPWQQSSKITVDGKVVAVDTPGHVHGHVSLIVYGDDGEHGHGTVYFLAADATYGVDLLDKEEPDGINDDPETALESLRLIKQFAQETDLVVLPSHDPDVARLLRNRVVYRPNATP